MAGGADLEAEIKQLDLKPELPLSDCSSCLDVCFCLTVFVSVNSSLLKNGRLPNAPASLAAADMTVITALPRNVKEATTTTVASCHSDDQTPTISAVRCGIQSTQGADFFFLNQGPKCTMHRELREAHTNINSVFTRLKSLSFTRQ